jgi:hypothetical protein
VTIAEICIFAALVLIIASIGPAKAARGKDGRAFDNARPRDPGFYASGLPARALGAHQNGWESFPFFIAAVLLAEFRGVGQGTVNGLAVAYLLARMLFVWLYLTDRPSARSLAWTAGFAVNAALFLSPWWAGR